MTASSRMVIAIRNKKPGPRTAFVGRGLFYFSRAQPAIRSVRLALNHRVHEHTDAVDLNPNDVAGLQTEIIRGHDPRAG